MTAANQRSDVVHALSFDIEDWFHMVAIDAVADTTKWPELPTLVERYTDQILDTVGRHQVRATFFVLGWVAERYPALVRRIAEAGHELGCHSYWHGRVDQMTPSDFRQDTQQAMKVIEQHGGHKVRGYRAPSFSITPGAEWAFDVLRELGFEYDASLFPASAVTVGTPALRRCTTSPRPPPA